MKIILIIIVIVFNMNLCYSQVNIEWAERFGSAAWGSAIAVDDEGNVYVTGSVYDENTQDDYITIKYNSNGDLQWAQTYDGPGNANDESLALAIDGFGNVYVTGWSSGSGTSGDYATIKYGPDGDELWVQRYNGPLGNGSDIANAISVDDLGNVYVTGRSAGDSGTNLDYATIKYNTDGIQQWVQRYNGPGNDWDEATSIAVDNSGNVYVTGRSWGDGTGFECSTIKYSSDGTELWVHRFTAPGSVSEGGHAIAVDNSGNVYVSGQTDGLATNLDYLTIKYNPDGVVQWIQTYDGPVSGSDLVYAMVIDDQGNVYVTGDSDGDGYATVKYDSDGVEQWVQRNGLDYGYAIAVDLFGDVYVAGDVYTTSSSDYGLVKYNSEGVQQWVQYYNGPGNNNDHARAVAIDDSGYVYVTGASDDNPGRALTTIKYSQEDFNPVGINFFNGTSPEIFSLEQNYPNPFNPVTTIRYSIPESGFVSLKVYDVLGREAAALVSEEKSPGVYEVQFDGSSIASGVYYYRLSAGSFTQTKKLMLVK